MKTYNWICWLLWILLSLLDFRVGWSVAEAIVDTQQTELMTIALGMLMFVFAAGILRWSFMWRYMNQQKWLNWARNTFIIISLAMVLLTIIALSVENHDMMNHLRLYYMITIIGAVFGGLTGLILSMVFLRTLKLNQV